jgi:hypothetical protein
MVPVSLKGQVLEFVVGPVESHALSKQQQHHSSLA